MEESDVIKGFRSMAASDRKKRIMEHLARSTGDFTQRSTTNNAERKQQIMEHVRRTKG